MSASCAPSRHGVVEVWPQSIATPIRKRRVSPKSSVKSYNAHKRLEKDVTAPEFFRVAPEFFEFLQSVGDFRGV